MVTSSCSTYLGIFSIMHCDPRCIELRYYPGRDHCRSNGDRTASIPVAFNRTVRTGSRSTCAGLTNAQMLTMQCPVGDKCVEPASNAHMHIWGECRRTMQALKSGRLESYSADSSVESGAVSTQCFWKHLKRRRSSERAAITQWCAFARQPPPRRMRSSAPADPMHQG